MTYCFVGFGDTGGAEGLGFRIQGFGVVNVGFSFSQSSQNYVDHAGCGPAQWKGSHSGSRLG